MKWVTSVDGSLCVRESDRPEGPSAADGFVGALVPRAVHELVFDARTDAAPLRPAVMGVRAALRIEQSIDAGSYDARQAHFSRPVMSVENALHRPAEAGLPQNGSCASTDSTATGSTAARGFTSRGATSRATAVIWFDPHGTLYPPALAAAGVPLDRLFVLRVRPSEVAAVAVDCLRCPGVAAVVAPLPAMLSRVEARRLQLAAEHGGGVGIVLRETGRGSDIYAAATRWHITAAPGDRQKQRWAVRLLHGRARGRSIGDTFWLEGDRASSDRPLVLMHPSAPLAHHAPPPPRAAATG